MNFQGGLYKKCCYHISFLGSNNWIVPEVFCVFSGLLHVCSLFCFVPMCCLLSNVFVEVYVLPQLCCVFVLYSHAQMCPAMFIWPPGAHQIWLTPLLTNANLSSSSLHNAHLVIIIIIIVVVITNIVVFIIINLTTPPNANLSLSSLHTLSSTMLISPPFSS